MTKNAGTGLHISTMARFTAGMLLVLFILTDLFFRSRYSGDPTPPVFPSDLYNEEVVAVTLRNAPWPEVRPQTYAFILSFMLLVASAMCFAFMPRNIGSVLSPAAGKICFVIDRITRSALLFLAGIIVVWFVEVRRMPYQLFDRLSSSAFESALLIILLLPAVYRASETKIFKYLIGPLILFAAGILCSINFFQTPDLSSRSYGLYTAIQWHFSFVMGLPGIFAKGLHVWTNFLPFYGILTPALVAEVIKHSHDFEFGTYFHIVQFMQILMFCIVPITLLALYRSTSRLLTHFIVPSCFVVPFLCTSNFDNWFPNLTGWRVIGFPIAALFLANIRSANFRLISIAAGLLASFEMTNSLEVGIATTAGLILFALLSAARKEMIIVLFLLFGTITLSFLLQFLVFLVLYGHSPLPSFEQMSEFYTLLANPWSGFELRDVDLLAVIIAFHSCTIIFMSAMRWRYGAVSHLLKFQAALATIIMVWLSYYFKHPQTSYLWFDKYIYAFLLPSAIDLRLFAIERFPIVALPRAQTLFPFLVTAIILQGWSNMIHTVYAQSTTPLDPNSELLSGVWTNREVAEGLKAQANRVKMLAANHSVVYASDNSFILPLLSGVYPDTPGKTLFFSSFSTYRCKLIVAKIRQSTPDYVLIDNLRPNGEMPWGEEHVENLYSGIIRSLEDLYRFEEDKDGWKIYSLKKQ